MKVIFCEDPVRARFPDELYSEEYVAAQSLSIPDYVMNYEALARYGDPAKSVKRVPNQETPDIAIYRGWMLRPAQYQDLYRALEAKGLRLINDPDQYLHCHHLPESYGVIEKATPMTTWMPVTGKVSIDDVMQKLAIFGSKPVIVKDYVKSQKHYWNEACFIPSASDRDAVQRVISRFLELQGEDLKEGLVFREFIEFDPLGHHSKSGMPLTKEFRFFVLDGAVLYTSEYWEDADYQGVEPPVGEFADILKQVKSRFFTMDVAKRKSGEWMIVELGDAQVAGLPSRMNVQKLYKSLVRGIQ